jgi:branched-subunit amino acid transport protein
VNVWLLLVLAAALTYGARASALLLPELTSERAQQVVARIPAPLFAGLALATLLGAGDGTPPIPMLVAAGAATLVAPRRSLGATLAAGVVGYLAAVVWS